MDDKKLKKKKLKNKKLKKKAVKKVVKYIMRNPKIDMTPQVIYRQGLTQTLNPENTKSFNEVVKLKNDYEYNNQLINRNLENERIMLNNRMDEQNKSLLNRLDEQTKYFNNMGSQLSHKLLSYKHPKVIIEDINDFEDIEPIEKPKKVSTPLKQFRSDKGKSRTKKLDFNIQNSTKEDSDKYDSPTFSAHEIYHNSLKNPDAHDIYYNELLNKFKENQDDNQQITLEPVKTTQQELKNNNKQAILLEQIPKIDVKRAVGRPRKNPLINEQVIKEKKNKSNKKD
jgi:hypothetical protein